jgi:hypothetical protein
MPIANNPAGRLYAFLEAAGHVDQKFSIGRVWASVLEQPGDKTDVMADFGEVLKLPQQTLVAIRQLVNDSEFPHYADWRDTVQNVLTRHWDESWGQVVGALSAQNLKSLKFCDIELARHSTEPTIADDEFHAIFTSVQELLSDVVDADIDKDVRHFVIDHLRTIELALYRFRIGGTKPVRDAANGVLGSLLVRQDLARKKGAVGVLQRLVKVAVRIAWIMNTLNTGFELTQQIQHLLGDGIDIDVIPPSSEPSEPAKDTETVSA